MCVADTCSRSRWRLMNRYCTLGAGRNGEGMWRCTQTSDNSGHPTAFPTVGITTLLVAKRKSKWAPPRHRKKNRKHTGNISAIKNACKMINFVCFFICTLSASTCAAPTSLCLTPFLKKLNRNKSDTKNNSNQKGSRSLPGLGPPLQGVAHKIHRCAHDEVSLHSGQGRNGDTICHEARWRTGKYI